MEKNFFLNRSEAILCFILLISSIWAVPSEAQWFEFQSPAIGNIQINKGNFNIIPDSSYVLYWKGDNLVTFDVFSNRGRGWKILDNNLYHFDILPNKDVGWTVYYARDGRVGKIPIRENGEFGTCDFLPFNYEGEIYFIFGIPERDELCLGTDKKIYLYSLKDDEWIAFDYPPGFIVSENIRWLYDYVADNKNTLFVLSVFRDSEDRQMIIFDLKTHDLRLLTSPDEDFFTNIRDIKKWNGHEDLFLILKEDALGLII